MNVDEAMVRANNYRDSKNRWKNLKYEITTSELVAISLSAEVDRLRAELAEAKAASVLPVKIRELCADGYVGNLEAYCDNADAAKQLHDWLRDRVKERGEG